MVHTFYLQLHFVGVSVFCSMLAVTQGAACPVAIWGQTYNISYDRLTIILR